MTIYSSRKIGMLLFLLGIGFVICGYYSLRHFTKVSSDNYLAPAGLFISGKKSFSFALLGDSRLNNTTLDAVLRDITGGDYAFTMHVGDQAGDFSGSHFGWILQELQEVMGDEPFYAVPGNHDRNRDDPDDQLRLYKRFFGQPEYWFAYGDTLFICLDSSNGTFSKKQAQWLDSILSRLRDSFGTCMLITHMPPIDPRPGKTHCLKSGVDQLKRIIQKHRVSALFAGHLHFFTQTEFGGVPLYISPSSGQKRREGSKHFGYLDVSIGSDGTISVSEVPVTMAEGREHLEYFFSTEVVRVPMVATGLLLILFGFWMTTRTRPWFIQT